MSKRWLISTKYKSRLRSFFFFSTIVKASDSIISDFDDKSRLERLVTRTPDSLTMQIDYYYFFLLIRKCVSAQHVVFVLISTLAWPINARVVLWVAYRQARSPTTTGATRCTGRISAGLDCLMNVTERSWTFLTRTTRVWLIPPCSIQMLSWASSEIWTKSQAHPYY